MKQMTSTLNYRLAGFGSILGIILSFPSFGYGFSSITHFLNPLIYKSLLLLIIIAVNYLIFMGFIHLSVKLKTRQLRRASITLLSALIFWNLINLAKTFLEYQLVNLLAILSFAILGIVLILFGITLVKIPKKVSHMLKPLGILNLISGIMHVTAVLYLLVPFINIIILTIEAIFFFNLSSKKI